MTDRGLAALAAALTDLFPAAQHDRWPFTPQQVAAAILGERGVFLPDGLLSTSMQLEAIAARYEAEVAASNARIAVLTGAKPDPRLATIACLRAALDGLVVAVPEAELAARFGNGDRYPLGGEVEIEGRIFALRAALAKAKEATDD